MEILYPVFTLFVLTAFAILRLGIMRFLAVRKRDVDFHFFEAYRDYEEPENLRIASRHVINLFEVPTLFYVVAILILVTEQTSTLLLVLAWAFVAARYLHTIIHLTSNKVILRFQVFVLSFFVLVVMWIAFAARVIQAA